MRIAVLGAGPAGLSAACSAAEGLATASVSLIDDNPEAGGQIWRGDPGRWPVRLQKAGVTVHKSTRVISAERTQLLLDGPIGFVWLPFDKLIVATGSRELFLPFPGWTLPGVMGAGGLQAMVKAGLPVKRKNIVIAGTGPLLLAVAHHLQAQGATVLRIAEQTSWARLFRFGTRLPFPKMREAVALWNHVYSPGTWVTEAHGSGNLESVTLHRAGRLTTLACDYLATGYGLVPNNELLQALNLDRAPLNQYQQLGDSNIYVAGEASGTGGADLAAVEGKIAGYAASGRLDRAQRVFQERARWVRFAAHLSATFALRPELKRLAQAETIVCRCEDVPLGKLQLYSGWREAKLQTRCGMGPCQGRICGPITRHLLGWSPGSVRPPVFPAPVGSFMLKATDN